MRFFNQQTFQPLDTSYGGPDVNISLAHFQVKIGHF